MVSIFIINLDRSPERLAHMHEQMSEIRMPFQRRSAVDGSNLDDDVVRHCRSSFWHRPLRPGEVGCFASHYRIWQHMVDDDIPVAVVLEDDIQLGAGFVEAVATLAPERLDFVRLSKLRRAEGPILHRIGDFDVVEDIAFSKFSGAGAYMIGREGARKLLAHADAWVLPVDDYVDCAWLHGVRTLEVSPPVVEQTVKFGSEINPHPLGSTHAGGSKALREIHRTARWLCYAAHLVGTILPDHVRRRLSGVARASRSSVIASL